MSLGRTSCRGGRRRVGDMTRCGVGEESCFPRQTSCFDPFPTSRTPRPLDPLPNIPLVSKTLSRTGELGSLRNGYFSASRPSGFLTGMITRPRPRLRGRRTNPHHHPPHHHPSHHRRVILVDTSKILRVTSPVWDLDNLVGDPHPRGSTKVNVHPNS